MNIGSELTAPEGWCCLSKGVRYYMVKNDPQRLRILLVHFGTGKRPTCHLVAMPRGEFEEGLSSGSLVERCAATLPPWLDHLADKTVAQMDEEHPNRKRTYAASIEQRKAWTAPLFEEKRLGEILSADDPCREIGREAAKAGQNGARWRLWFFCRLCFTHELALCDRLHTNGKWERKAKPTKMGRRSKSKGAAHGYPMTLDMENLCETGFLGVVSTEKTRATIYSQVMKEHFGCSAKKTDGAYVFFHPKGRPFPSYAQFWYAVEKRIEPEDLEVFMYGAKHVRAKRAASEGRYSESVSNFLERGEMDGKYMKERPRGLVTTDAMPALCKVRLACVTSAYISGIGFSLGGESGRAYCNALFCSAIGLPRFLSLWGLSSEGVPHLSGLPPQITIDRGAGRRLFNLKTPEERSKFVIQMAPSYDGQAKATVESRHERSRHLEEEPNYKVSHLNVVEMVKRELLREIGRNDGADASDRLTDDMLVSNTQRTPSGMATYLAKRGRSDAFNIPFEQAVRLFLMPVQVTVQNDGVYLLNYRRYDSHALRKTGVIKAKSSGGVKLRGYVLELNLRTMWVEVEGRLIEVQAHLPIADDESGLYISHEELAILDEMRREMGATSKEHRMAAMLACEERFEKETGKKFDGGRRVRGRTLSRRSIKSAAKQDIAVLVPRKAA